MVFVARSAQGCLLVARFAGALALAAAIFARLEQSRLALSIAQPCVVFSERVRLSTVDALGAVVDMPGTVIITSLAGVITPLAFSILPPVRGVSSITLLLTQSRLQEIRPVRPTLGTILPPSSQVVTLLAPLVTVKREHHVVVVEAVERPLEFFVGKSRYRKARSLVLVGLWIAESG